MEHIRLEKTSNSPQVDFNPHTGILDIRGISRLQNAKDFYEPIASQWLDRYLRNLPPTTTINIHLDFYNTSSSMWIYQMLKKLVLLKTDKHELIVNWYYSDDDIRDAGEDFQQLLHHDFNFQSMGRAHHA